MKYKALLLDVDGTLVPVGPHTIPSEKVRKAIQDAQDLVKVSLVSGRPLDWLKETFSSLGITNPCVINGGSQIIDPTTHRILWERPILTQSLNAILAVIEEMNIPSFTINDNGIEYKNPKDHTITKPLAVQLSYFDSKDSSDDCLRMLQKIPDISCHKFYSWDKGREYRQEIYITHSGANKQQAVHELLKMSDVEPSEIIAIGDSRNDIPLLEICGLKVAMGNADSKLKLVADYIAPTVDEDGVAHVIEKFIVQGESLPEKRKGFFSSLFT